MMRRLVKLSSNMLLLMFLMTLLLLPISTVGFMHVEEKGVVLSTADIRIPDRIEKETAPVDESTEATQETPIEVN